MIVQFKNFKQTEVYAKMNYRMNWIKADCNQGQPWIEMWD